MQREFLDGERVQVVRANFRRHQNLIGEVGTVKDLALDTLGVLVLLDKYPETIAVMATTELERAKVSA